MKRLRPERREDIPDDAEIQRFVDAANPAFRQTLIFQRETGCRPGEAYMMRHQYITDALARGVPISIIAEVTGTSAEMIARTYSHISEKKSLLLEAVNHIRPA